MTKADAFTFLRRLQGALEQDLPDPAYLRAEIRRVASSADSEPHMRKPEEAFLNTYVIPCLFRQLQSQCGLSEQEAKAALLSENYRHLQSFCSGSPARSERHPFDKTLAPDPSKIMMQWKSGKSNALRQSCPDFALRDPCPYTIVFEGKYFEQGSTEKAEADLVRNIYQAFFYRALPKITSNTTRPPWDYEFSCCLACDASLDGALRRAWDSLDSTVQAGFWNGANVYVMVLRGAEK